MFDSKSRLLLDIEEIWNLIEKTNQIEQDQNWTIKKDVKLNRSSDNHKLWQRFFQVYLIQLKE